MSEIVRPSESMAERWRRSQDEDSRQKSETMAESAGPDEAAPPARCPVCRSQEVSTTGKSAAVDAYWRCGSCGEVWNVGRHRAGSRYARDLPPFRR